MNNDQLHKRLTALRVPAPGRGARQTALHRALEAFESDAAPDVSRPANAGTPWSLRDWFWPSPYAWAAFAAVWVTYFAVSFSPGAPWQNDGMPGALAATKPSSPAPVPPAVFALNEYRALVLEYQQLSLRR